VLKRLENTRDRNSRLYNSALEKPDPETNKTSYKSGAEFLKNYG